MCSTCCLCSFYQTTVVGPRVGTYLLLWEEGQDRREIALTHGVHQRRSRARDREQQRPHRKTRPLRKYRHNAGTRWETLPPHGKGAGDGEDLRQGQIEVWSGGCCNRGSGSRGSGSDKPNRASVGWIGRLATRQRAQPRKYCRGDKLSGVYNDLLRFSYL